MICGSDCPDLSSSDEVDATTKGGGKEGSQAKGVGTVVTLEKDSVKGTGEMSTNKDSSNSGGQDCDDTSGTDTQSGTENVVAKENVNDQESTASNDNDVVTCFSHHVQKRLPCGHLGCNFHTSSQCRMCDLEAAAHQKENQTMVDNEDDDKRDSLALVSTENNGEVINEERHNVREVQPEVIDMLDDDTDTDDDESIEVISAHDGEDSDCSDLYKSKQPPLVIDMIDDSSDDEEDEKNDCEDPKKNQMDCANDEEDPPKRMRLNDGAAAASPQISSNATSIRDVASLSHKTNDDGATYHNASTIESTSTSERNCNTSILKDVYLVEEVMTQAKSKSLKNHLSKWYEENSKNLKRPSLPASTSTRTTDV